MALIYYVIYAAAGSKPSAAQVKAGKDATGSAAVAAGSEAELGASGVMTWSSAATGLSPATSYKIAFVHADGADGDVVESVGWDTTALAELAATGDAGAFSGSANGPATATLSSATGGSGELTASAGEPVVATRVLSSYRPLPPPADPKDVGRWAMNEFLTIARHLADGRDFDLLNTIHAPPSKPREGMVVHADGTNWDPGSGAGRYERVGGAWVKL